MYASVGAEPTGRTLLLFLPLPPPPLLLLLLSLAVVVARRDTNGWSKAEPFIELSGGCSFSSRRCRGVAAATISGRYRNH